jgi:hypothetical protein
MFAVSKRHHIFVLHCSGSSERYMHFQRLYHCSSNHCHARRIHNFTKQADISKNIHFLAFSYFITTPTVGALCTEQVTSGVIHAMYIHIASGKQIVGRDLIDNANFMY